MTADRSRYALGDILQDPRVPDQRMHISKGNEQHIAIEGQTLGKQRRQNPYRPS